MKNIKALAERKNSFEIRNKTAVSAEIIIYDQIGGGMWEDGISAKSFDKELKSLDSTVKTLNVRINSPGGDVFDGVAIYNRLKQHKANVIVHIDGLAASIASIIALAGDEVIMGEGALFMVHLPWTFAMGNRTDLENISQRLIDIEEQMLGIYSKRSGLDRNELRAMLEAETWLDSDQTIELGFATSKAEEEVAIAASAFEHRWINKTPKNFTTTASVIKREALELSQKIEEQLKARK